ncbi:MAG: bifunctional folylpolyglutamate synthase/dihydrofolate synthase [Gallionella sp.]|nr:bifunctional folylpolyglutamate synthase/dihydrofolate synthase [Gallionella sp.]
MPTTLPDWLTHLESLNRKTISLGLDRVAEVKQRMNLSPDFPVIVVGGTNGKGSVCAMLESILFAAGYRVGCYTSPHLLEYNERVRIDKRAVSDADLCASFTAIEQARLGVNALTPTLSLGERERKEELGDIALTYFEFGTLAAMQLFIERRVDVAILEVGLGGRLDAVNVFDSDCAIVTSIDIDHIDYLGDTRELIGFEKAGIFRSGKVAICAEPNVPDTLAKHAQDIGATLWQIGTDFGFKPVSMTATERSHQMMSIASDTPPANSPPQQWDFYSPIGARASLPYPALRGAFQLGNASAVLAALDVLKEKLPVNMESVRRGLVEVTLTGRFQTLPGKPTVILDVAHNPHAAHSLAQNWASLPTASCRYAVFAMLKDKDMEGVIAALQDQVDVWLVASIHAPRGATADEVSAVLQACHVHGDIQKFDDPTAAFVHACNVAGENDRITAFGSFYTVAEVLQAHRLHR